MDAGSCPGATAGLKGQIFTPGRLRAGPPRARSIVKRKRLSDCLALARSCAPLRPRQVRPYSRASELPNPFRSLRTAEQVATAHRVRQTPRKNRLNA